MLELLGDIGIFIALAIACFMVAKFLQNKKTEILFAISTLVQKIESEVKGSNMGEEKKRRVMNELRIQGIKINAFVSKAIDDIVAYLNKTGGWLKSQAVSNLDSIPDKTTGDDGNA